METGESNLYYCIIVKYTKARVREVFLLFGYVYRQKLLPLFLWRIIYMWCLSGFGVVFALSQLISGIWVFTVPVVFCDCFFLSVLQYYRSCSSFSCKQIKTSSRDLDATLFLSCIGLIGPFFLKLKNSMFVPYT